MTQRDMQYRGKPTHTKLSFTTLHTKGCISHTTPTGPHAM